MGSIAIAIKRGCGLGYNPIKWNQCKHVHQLINTVRLNYETTGNGTSPAGKVALCLPGSMGCAETDFAPQLKSLGNDGFEVICWDPPGYGKSRPPSRKFNLHFFEEDAVLASSLMKKLGHSKYSLLGWSDGGITSIFIASLFPDELDKLVVWGANAYIHEGDIQNYLAVRDLDNWSEKMRAPLEKIYGKEYFKTTWESWIDTMLCIYKEREGNICKEKLKDISCPTLIIHGKKDKMVDEEHANYLLANIKGSRLVMFENGAHNLHLKYAEEFNKLVTKFLNDEKI